MMEYAFRSLDTYWFWAVRTVVLVVAVSVLLVAGSPTGSATEEVPAPLAEAVQRALQEWSDFGTTGDLAVFGMSFAGDGPQWQQFESESIAERGSLGSEPLRLEAQRMRLRSLDPTTATVWVEVKASREGFRSETFTWDFDLIRRDGPWQVWTVVETDEPRLAVPAPQPPPSTGAVSPTTAVEPEVAEASPAERQLPPVSTDGPRGTRIPALGAWFVVLTVVGVAVAGYVAPRVDRRGEG